MYEKLLNNRYKISLIIIFLIAGILGYNIYKEREKKRRILKIEIAELADASKKYNKLSKESKRAVELYEKLESLDKNSIYYEYDSTKIKVELDHPDASSAEIESLTNQRLLLNKK